ncbi:purple acid phosphatase family protein [Salinicoccus halodurans]|uniref:Calcineurin-like phosphoesterase n=1 Tax=Salinicoccus halodurans TaxID=407035 RepID=A0A0F7HJ36_9STAP|nr:metallophosphoesterase family protein [Salinicoccus halodurans]AKG73031.1 serine/threonine protein phosphatase [Salinicoccus halodurans]SFK77763.1 Calcineurin-like phosphoesterase [Salinicoccus halodurans]
MGFNLSTNRNFSAGVVIASVIFALAISLFYSPLVHAAGGGGPTGSAGDPAESTEENDAEEFDPVLTETKPEVADVEPNNLPNRIMTTFNGDTSSEMGFSWYTTDHFKDSKVWISKSGNFDDTLQFEAEAKEVTSSYGERDENGNYIFAEVKEDEEGEAVEDENGEPVINGYYTDRQAHGDEWMSGDYGHIELTDVTEYSYKAKATGLEPNTTYYYQVGSGSGKVSEFGKFKTSGENGDPFKFVHYTDTQNAFWNENVRNEAAFGADTLKRALETAGDADFALHTGDIVEVAEVEDEWVDLYEQSRPYFMQTAMAVAPGNHDEYALNYGDEPLTEKFNEHVNVPVTNEAVSGGSYYSFDYNGVHFVTLNTNDNKESEDNPDGKAIGEEQMKWISEDVKKARENGAEWIVLNYHKPLYSKSYHSLQDEDVQKVREELTALIDELDIDLALQGHDHVISRTHSLTHVPTEENFSNAEVEDVKTHVGQNGVEYMENPDGTVYVLPNTGGTKEYDDVYSKGLEHLHEVRPDLDWMTQEDLDHYNSLFGFGSQPQETDAFAESHSNNRDSSTQNFAVYEVVDDEMIVRMYQISGELLEGEPRKVELIDEFGIHKDAKDQEVEETEDEAA